jgi:hypothetical protein
VTAQRLHLDAVIPLFMEKGEIAPNVAEDLISTSAGHQLPCVPEGAASRGRLIPFGRLPATGANTPGFCNLTSSA